MYVIKSGPGVGLFLTVADEVPSGAPLGSIDGKSTLEPQSLGDRAKLEAELATKPDPSKLVQEGVLKRECGVPRGLLLDCGRALTNSERGSPVSKHIPGIMKIVP